MHTHSTPRPEESPAAPSGAAIDFADLVSLLVSLHAPSREVDSLVEAMLGGAFPVPVVTPRAVISIRWLADETPCYTAGGSALSVLAHRRGYRIHVSGSSGRYIAEARNLASGMLATATAPTEGGAGIAAICSLAAAEATNA